MVSVKALLFDFGGTLDNDGVHWFDRLHRLIVQQGGPLNREVFESHADIIARGLDKFDDTSTLPMAGLAMRLCSQIHERLSAYCGNGGLHWQPEKVTEAFMAEAGEFLARSKVVLGRLGQRYRLGCISNNWGNTAGWCEEFSLSDHFETIVDSTVVGSSKPDGLIFETALKELGLAAEDCAYIGDWFAADVIGARGVGMKTVWIDDGSKECPDESLVDYRIKGIADLAELRW